MGLITDISGVWSFCAPSVTIGARERGLSYANRSMRVHKEIIDSKIVWFAGKIDHLAGNGSIDEEACLVSDKISSSENTA
jgi:hypothetical protein